MTEQQIFDVRFEVTYSYYLEKLTEIFNRRLEKLLLFIQFLLGGTVITGLGLDLLLGFLIAVIAGIQFAFKPGEMAGSARQQSQRYSVLLDEFDMESIEVIKKNAREIEKTDNAHPGSLAGLARFKAATRLGVEPDVDLSRVERFFAFFCGQSLR
ncbi:TPA: hypothetical protein PXL93_004165 [Yersinia enterocolitica]|nr:hypothetical protein [Yersinia enterocolitica]HDL6901520.1 hypothetical protein [Yersinia enterocolitica]